MSTRKVLTALAVVAGLILFHAEEAKAQACLPFGPQTGTQLEQTFPVGSHMLTAWRITYGRASGKGLFITGAFFKKSPSAPWMRVIWDARLANIFVPYHPGSPRYYDLTGYSFSLVNVATVDLGPCGKKADSQVVKEIRDRGMLWKDDTAGRRAHELVLWATLDAANYNYMMLYSFRDDGSIGFRLGATARNLPGMELVPHTHDGLWRVDVDLNGFTADSVYVHRHNETTASAVASDTLTVFNGGKEGFLDWNPLQFTELNVRDEATRNAQGKRISYDLMLQREGTPRHREPFSHHDFWVTRYSGIEQDYTQVSTYTNGQAITNADIVLWYISPAHHMPRSEDGRATSGVWRGVALAMWAGFDLRPRDLFDTTPLFP